MQIRFIGLKGAVCKSATAGARFYAYSNEPGISRVARVSDVLASHRKNV